MSLAFLTSAGNFDVGSGQSDGRHSHVEADIVVEEEALAGRWTILQEALLFDADRRLRAILVNFVAAITIPFLALLFLPVASVFVSARFAILVLFFK